MAPPTAEDGLERAIEFALPSMGVVLAVSFTKGLYGGVAAGLIYLLLWGFILFGFYSAITHWNIPYTASFVIAAFILWTMTPNVVSEITHPVFGAIGSVMGLVFFAWMAILLLEKTGLDELLNEF